MLRLIGFLSASLVALAACSPTFNWREAHWAQVEVLKVLLPCKPDQGSRPMHVAERVLTMHLMGCEAGGALFVVAVVDVRDGPHAIEVQRQWQQAMLDTMRAGASPDSVRQEAFVVRGASEQPPPVRLYARGKRAEGQELRVQALWFARGGRLYHAVIYFDALSADVVETFFEGLRFP